jgi:transposase
MLCRMGRPPSRAFALGSRTARGSASTITCAPRAARTWGASPSPLQRSLRPSRGRRPTKGGDGYDGAKQLNGRTRHLLVETTGLLLRVLGHAAALREAVTAPGLLAAAFAPDPQWRRMWADMASRRHARRLWLAADWGGGLELVQRPRRWGRSPLEVDPPPMPALTVLPRRWVVERTIVWIGRDRRLRKDSAYRPEHSETMRSVARSRLMLRRLARQAPYGVPSPQRHGLRGLARAF